MKRKLKFEIRMVPCKKCGGAHADFWKSTPAPSCAEREEKRR